MATRDPITFTSDKRLRIVAVLGRTGAGKTSFYNLMTGEREALGDHINSKTQVCVQKKSSDNRFRYIDTIGFKDTQRENESHLKIVEYFTAFKDGLDVIFYVTSWQCFTSDDRNIFDDTFRTILTSKALANTCLLLTNCSNLDLKTVNQRGHTERQELVRKLHTNTHYGCVLNKIDDRVVFVDIEQNENAGTRRITSNEVTLNFLHDFKCEHFSNDNITAAARLINDVETFKAKVSQLTTDNEKLRTQLASKVQEFKAVTAEYYEMKNSYKNEMKQNEEAHKTNVENMISTQNELIKEKDLIEEEVALLQQDLANGPLYKVLSWVPVINIATKICDLIIEDTISARFDKILKKKNKRD
ncbi:unnamed protein product [Didymodactylos carnosus]|uniref:G domain-containing protein n=1 Tax=Didymodactylos carnosus TaxID=1234261 RepID=A0A815U796_9BILA|nr:unnamed protein product [Didymodactylos carnosus]CAF4374032.1 unnamed protein product [Didymodactylos carnosus]